MSMGCHSVSASARELHPGRDPATRRQKRCPDRHLGWWAYRLLVSYFAGAGAGSLSPAVAIGTPFSFGSVTL